MDIREAIKNRHSVRQFKSDSIELEKRDELDMLAEECNGLSGLNIQVIYDDAECFDTLLAHYGKFTNVRNYIAIVGDKSIDDLEELSGYFGEKMVIRAQQLGLNTCWVGLTYGKGKCKAEIGKNEKWVCVIALGYGETEGTGHKSKSVRELCNVEPKDMPIWFKNGMVSAMKAPTAMNQQKFYMTLGEDGEVSIAAKKGFFAEVDLGIIKYHFEVISGRKCKI